MALHVLVQEGDSGWVAKVSRDPSGRSASGATGEEALGILVRDNPELFGIDGSLVFVVREDGPSGSSCEEPDPDDPHTLDGLNRRFPPSGQE